MTPASAAERRAVWLLAVGQTLGYACFFYIFAAMAVSRQEALGGVAATLAFPAAAALTQALGWQGTVRVAAAVAVL
ncbi:MAG: hypothetical protein ACK5UA_02490, partial [Cereibacter sp.]